MVVVATSAAGSNPLGTATVIIDGGTLSLDATLAGAAIALTNPVQVSNSGTIEAIPNAATFNLSGGITYGSGSPTLTLTTWDGGWGGVQTAPGPTLQISGQITGNGGLVITNTPVDDPGYNRPGNAPGTVSITYAGGNTTFSGTTTVTGATNSGGAVIGTALTLGTADPLGTSALVVNNGGEVVNSFAGGLGAESVTINSLGSVTINSAGTASSVTGFTVNTNGALVVDDTGSNNSGNPRLGAAIPLNLNGGTFSVLANNSSTSNEQIGPITIGSGNSTFNLNKGYGLTLTAASITSAVTSYVNSVAVAPFVNFQGAISGTTSGDQLVFTTSPTLTSTDGIFSYATITNPGTSFDLATVTSNDLAVPTYTATTLGAVTGTNTAIVKISAADSSMLAAGVSPYAVVVQGNETITGLGTLSTGMLAVGGTDTFNLPVNVGSQGMLISAPSAAATFDGVISGAALNVLGSGTTILNNTDSYTGPTTLESGTLSIGNATGLGSGALNLYSGTVQASINTTVSNNVYFNNSLVTFGGATPLNFTGTVNVSGTNVVAGMNTGGTIFSSSLTGSGSLTLANTVAPVTQTITLGGTGLGGTFTLFLNGEPLATLPYNATQAQMQAAFASLPYTTTVTGAASPWTVTFSNVPAGTTIPLLTATSALTGTSVTIATSASAASPAGTLILAGNNSASAVAFTLATGNLVLSNAKGNINNTLPPTTTLSGGTLLADAAISGLNAGAAYATSYAVTGASESGNTATITYTGAANFSVGQFITVSGVSVAG